MNERETVYCCGKWMVQMGGGEGEKKRGGERYTVGGGRYIEMHLKGEQTGGWEENNIVPVTEGDKLRDQRFSSTPVTSRRLSAGSSTSWTLGLELWLPRLSLTDL